MRSHRRWRLAPALVLAVFWTGCAAKSFDALMESWTGRTRADLVRTWGAPAYEYANSAGGVVLVYVPASSVAADNPMRVRPRGFSYDEEEIVPAPKTEYRSSLAATWPIHRIFFIDADGRIYRSQWRGEWVCCSM